MVQIKVRMMGLLKEASGRTEEELILDDGADISTVIRILVNEHGEEMKNALLDPVLQNPLPNALVLLNGVEISNLLGLTTTVGDGDVLVLLSVTHGG